MFDRVLDVPLLRQVLRPLYNNFRRPKTHYLSTLNSSTSLSSRCNISKHNSPNHRNIHRKINNLSMSISTRSRLLDSSSINFRTGIPPRKTRAAVPDSRLGRVFLGCHMVAPLAGILLQASPFITTPLANTTLHNRQLAQLLSRRLHMVRQAHQLLPPCELHLLRQWAAMNRSPALSSKRRS